MRTTRRAAVVSSLAGSLMMITAGVAAASPAAAPEPQSRLVIGMGHGENSQSMRAERTVTLSCAPTVTGDHPHAVKACEDLMRVDGAFDSLAGLNQNKACTLEYMPITVTVDGYWNGHRISYEHTFPNTCVKSANASYLFRI
ncbi:SSI family serine proteinase inhibitor [Streptomyces sp. NPDC002506]|uniref:SSI family serine proteinase inhibitor n=1 Tax=Streptomyces sp. NPDC002506 TaxID=3154536 RepID=UPI00332B932F